MFFKVISISINRPASVVYRFVSNPKNLPKWASGFCLDIRKVRGKWVLDTPLGKVGFRFAKKNAFGVLDHFVRFKGKEIYVPMRVVSSGKESLVTLTIFRQKGMSEKAFRKDLNVVKNDLKRLKCVLES